MEPLTYATFGRWLAAYSQASIADNPLASAGLFAENARYYESPFARPLVGRQAIYDYWAVGARDLHDKLASHHVLAVRENLGMARWRSRFAVRATGEIVRLDCIFLAEFDEQGLCRCFREWWHSYKAEDAAR